MPGWIFHDSVLAPVERGRILKEGKRSINASTSEGEKQRNLQELSHQKGPASPLPAMVTVSDVMKVMEGGIPDDPTNPNSWNLVQLTFLLTTIVQESNGILDSKYADVRDSRQLVETHPDLRNTLIEAWNNQNYNEVLKTGMCLFQIYDEGKSSISSASSRADAALLQMEKEKLSFAMSLPYRGVAVDALYEYLEQNQHKFDTASTEQGYYAKFCSVVQSPGTGKTRNILELADRGVFLLYMNLRPTEDQSGYPNRDNIPAEILTGLCATEEEYHIRCCAFFAAIFKVVEDDLSTRLKSHGTAAVKIWSSEMCQFGPESQHRTNFFSRLKDAYNQIRRDIPPGNDSEQLLSATKIVPQYFNSMKDEFVSLFPEKFNGPKLVIAFDEAHPLHKVQNFRRSTVMSRIIHLYSQMSSFGDVWVLFASTTSKVTDFASPEALFKSARISRSGELIFPPFCELGWDLHAPSPNEVPLGEVAKAKHILQYGRPLWLFLMDRDGKNLHQVFTLMAQKLTASQWYNATMPEQALAVLGQRFCLDICLGHRESIAFLESSVSSHLRVIITTTEDCMWSYTTYPSEPFLSCAAAHRLHEDDDSLGTTFDTLKHKVDSGLIEMGQHGELVSRLLWLLAKDLFVIRKNKSRTPFASDNSFDTELYHCSMIPVVEFFEFVFGKRFWSLAGTKAKKAFKDAYVNFSHWISMESYIQQIDRKAVDQLSLNEWTMRHWQRTCAIQCCHLQPAIDKVIPIYFKSVDPGPGGADCMSQILISDKACASKQGDALSKIERTIPEISGAHEGSLNPLPYIAIVADLGLNTPGLEVTWRTTEEPSLRIRACALTPKTFQFLADCDSRVLTVLEYLVQRQEMPNPERPVAEYLRDKMRYGNSAEARYMEWERDPSKDLLEDYLAKENDANTAGPSKYLTRSKIKKAHQQAVLKQAVKKAPKTPRRDKKQKAPVSSGHGKGKQKASPEASNADATNDDEEAMDTDA